MFGSLMFGSLTFGSLTFECPTFDKNRFYSKCFQFFQCIFNVSPINPAMQSQCVQYVIAGHILILIANHIKVTSLGSFKMWTIFNWWTHCDYFVSVNTMSSQCTCWVFDPLFPVRSCLAFEGGVGQGEEGAGLLQEINPSCVPQVQ